MTIKTQTLKTLALGAAATALTFGMATAANAATVFSATIEVDQSTTPSPGFDGQIGQAALNLEQDDDGNYRLSMAVEFSDGFDFTSVESFFDDVEGSFDGDGDEVLGFHVHNAPRGVGGPVVFNIFDILDATPIEGTDDLDGDQTLTYNEDGSVTIVSEWDFNEGTGTTLTAFVAELLGTVDGEDTLLYFNLHTAAAPGGLIRGQIVGANDIGADAVPIPAAAFLFAPVVAGGIAARRRKQRA